MRTKLVAVSAAVVMAGTACGSGGGGNKDDGEAPVKADAEIVIALPGDPGTLDPTQTLSGTAQQINRFAYDSLAYVNEDGELVSGIAESWVAEPAELVFTIRPDVTCADGTVLTPSAIKAHFEYLKESKSAMIGTAIPDANYTVAADDEAGTFTFTSGQPNGFLLENVAAIPIVCEAGLADPDSLARASAGSGPYVLTEVVSADHYTLERRDGYEWGPGGADSGIAGLPKKVTFRIVGNEATTANLMLGGEVDIAYLTGPDRERLSEDQGFHITNVATDSLLMFFNQSEGLPASDGIVREALVRSVDRAEILQVATSGFGQESASMVSATPKTCDDSAAAEALLEEDAAAAAAALEAAGWEAAGEGEPRTLNGEELSIRLAVSVPGAAGQDAAEVLRQRWAELGVAVDLKSVAPAQLTDVLFNTRDFDAVLLPMQVSLPSTIYGLLVGPPPPDGTNFAALTNETYAELGEEALTTPGEAGCDGWTEAEAALYSNADVLPIGAATASYIGRNLTFDYIQGQIDPMSVKVFAN